MVKHHIHKIVLHIGRWTITIGQWTLVLSAIFIALLVAAYIATKVWLPEVAGKKQEIQALLAEQTGLNLKFDEINPYWHGVYPGLSISNVEVSHSDIPHRKFRIERLRASLEVMGLIRGRIELNNVILEVSRLELDRTGDKVFHINDWPLDAASRNQDPTLITTWLDRFHEVQVISKKVIWHDRFRTEKPFTIKNLELQLYRSRSEVSFNIRANFPESFCRACQFGGRVDYDRLAAGMLTGQLNIDAIDLDFEGMPRIVANLLPGGLSGRVQAQLWADIENNKLSRLKGDIISDDLNIPYDRRDRMLSINNFSSSLDWKFRDNNWQLLATQTRIALTGKEWSAGHLRLEKQDNVMQLAIGSVNITDIISFVNQLKLAGEGADLLAALSPRGLLNDFQVRIVGDPARPDAYSLKTSFSNLAIKAYKKYPEISGISGHIKMDEEGGSLGLETGKAIVGLPWMFRSQFRSEKLTGKVTWKRDNEQWRFIGNDLKLTSDDGNVAGDVEVRVPAEGGKRPWVDVRLEYQDVNGAIVTGYLPINLFSKKLVNYLDDAVRDGFVRTGRAVLKGDMNEFPFTNGNGEFYIAAQIENGKLNYLKNWTPLLGANAILMFNKAEMMITGLGGNIGGMEVSRVLVHAPNLQRPGGGEIRISGEATGSFDSILTVLQESEGGPNGLWPWLTSDIRGSGNGELSLELAFTPGSGKPPSISGIYRLDDANLKLPWGNLNVSQLNGNIDFDEQGAYAGKVRGKMLGGRSVMVVSRTEDNKKRGFTQLVAKGTADSKGLTDAFGSWLEPYLKGSVPWSGEMVIAEKPEIHMEAELSDLASSLPAPLQKKSGVNRIFKVTTRPAPADTVRLALEAKELLGGQLLYQRQNRRWQFWGGHVGLGEKSDTTVAEKGTKVTIKHHRLDLDAWLDVSRAYLSSGPKGEPWISYLDAHTEDIRFADRWFGEFHAELVRNKKDWSGYVTGPRIEGKIAYRSGKRASSWVAELARLHIPEGRSDKEGLDINPRSLPDLRMKVSDTRYSDMRLGSFDLEGVSEPLGWRVKRWLFKSPHYTFLGRGYWYYVGERSTAEGYIRVDAENLGKALADLGARDVIANGQGKFSTTLKWASAPSVAFRHARGNGSLKIKDGRLLQLEPGAGRILGLFDLSSLVRYLSLDFSTIFGKGYAFDSVKTQFRLDKGSAYTRDLKIKGPSADMLVTGRVGISDQDFDMVVGVNPSFADTLALTIGGLGAPQVGAAILLLKNVFDTDITAAPAINYSVKGPWEKPKVVRMGEAGATTQETTEDD